MPTHAGTFRRMLLGSTTAKVLNDADCPVLTSMHAETTAPRPLEHREWLCAIGLDADSERVLRFAARAAAEAQGKLHEPDLPAQVDLEDELQSTARREARQRIAELQKAVGSQAPVRIVAGSVKEALLEAIRRSDADVLMIGRNRAPMAVYGT